MSITDIGGIHLESIDGRTCGVDMRVYRWLEQWLSDEEARQLVHSLAWGRLVKLVLSYHRVIAAVKVW